MMRALKILVFAGSMMGFDPQARGQTSVRDEPSFITSALELLPARIKQTSWFPKLVAHGAEPLMKTFSILGADVFSGAPGVTDKK